MSEVVTTAMVSGVLDDVKALLPLVVASVAITTFPNIKEHTTVNTNKIFIFPM